jgi:predicted Zn-dependent peptidase
VAGAALAASAGCALLCIVATAAAAQDLKAFAARTTVHVVANGWTFILVERPVAPVFSFCTIADVGSAQEVPGITGLAHMFEHMAFKGTDRIGTRDPVGEKRAMDAAEAAYQAYQRERLAPHPDARKVAALYAEFKRLEGEAERFVVKNELDEILSRAGAVGVNASTAADQTEYFYSLPANEIELFAYVESERFWHPVFREFYEERDVVQEERRMRVDGEPQGRLSEALVATAFAAHPYHQPTIGYMSDLEAITRTDAEAFFRTHYVPANLVTAIVGDIHPETLVPLLDRYFGRIPARPPAPPLRTVEPPQTAAKSVALEDPAQPQLMMAYHRPAVTDPDDAASIAPWCATRSWRSTWNRSPACPARSIRTCGLWSRYRRWTSPARGWPRRSTPSSPASAARRSRMPSWRASGRGRGPAWCARWAATRDWPAPSPTTRRCTATGASSSARSTVSTASARPTSAASPAPPSPPPTAPWRPW